jgi:DNA-binding CsgD family transcriptional regulator
VLPMTTGELRAQLQPRATAAIFIDTSEGPGGVGLAASAFNLTSAETRILESLVAGRTLAETARHFGIAPSTAKTHLDHIFGKAGVSRQAELVRLTMQMTRPIVARDGQERG